MSKPDRSASSQGIETRHERKCRSHDGGKCNCTPTYRAFVFDKRANRKIRRTFPSKTAAKLWRQDALVALRRGEIAAVAPTSRTVRDALNALVAGMRDGTVLDRSGRRYRPATIRGYETAIRRYLAPSEAIGDFKLAELRRRDVQTRVVDKLAAKGFSGSTIRNKLDPLRVVYRRAIQDDEVTQTPCDNLRLPGLDHKPRAIGDPSRVGDLLEALPEALRAVWTVAFYCGLRVSELRALRWSAVDFNAGVIRVVAGWDDAEGEQDPKTFAGIRTVPLIGRVRAELARHKLATGRDGDDLCFGRTATEAFVRSTLRAHTLGAWKSAKLAPLTPHEARHTCASYFAAAGLTPKDAQTAMGHADIRTTLNLYAKAVPGWENAAASKLDAYLDAHAKRSREA
jgi:integrase